MYELGLCLLSDPEVSVIFMEIFPKETVVKNKHLKKDNFLVKKLCFWPIVGNGM